MTGRMKDGTLVLAQNIIARTMANDLAPLFTPDMKLTFVARSTENPDCYMILTDDELPKIIEAIHRHDASQPKRLCQQCQKPINPGDAVYIHSGPDDDVRSHQSCVERCQL